MDTIWHKMKIKMNNNIISPVSRLCLALSTRLKYHRKHGRGLLKLQDDVQTCEYEDVQVMWEMLQKTETSHQVIEEEEEDENHHHKRKQLPFWRVLVWSNSNHTHSLN